jgi:peptidoglycan/xylan/chitin deacetylase (PgdA/CDA1 family)
VSWHTNNWGTNTTQFTYLNTGHTGTHSVKTQMTAYTNGDAKWYFDAQPAVAGREYTFSDYYESDIATRVVVEFKNTDGTFTYQDLATAPAAADWTQYQATFTAPQGVQSFTILHVLSAIGFLTVDDYQLTNDATAGFNRGIVTLTWDDGVASQYTGAFPIMKKYGLTGTFYLISGFLNTDFYMTTAQAAEIKAAGNELGGHTIDHPDLTTVTAAQLQTELQQSQTDLQNIFGGSFTDFATPFGAYNDTVITAIQQYYTSHRTVDRGFNSKDNFDIYRLKIQQVDNTTTAANITAWINEAKATNTWLILMYHQVDNPTDALSISSSDLDAEYNIIKNSGLPVLTMQQALDEVVPQIGN